MLLKPELNKICNAIVQEELDKLHMKQQRNSWFIIQMTLHYMMKKFYANYLDYRWAKYLQRNLFFIMMKLHVAASRWKTRNRGIGNVHRNRIRDSMSLIAMPVVRKPIEKKAAILMRRFLRFRLNHSRQMRNLSVNLEYTYYRICRVYLSIKRMRRRELRVQRLALERE